MSTDLIESELKGYPLDMLSHGGAPAASVLTTRARAAFPKVTLFVSMLTFTLNVCSTILSNRAQGYDLSNTSR
jgi:hypothetical protein